VTEPIELYEPLTAREFSLAVWIEERNCVVCENPSSNAHHILRKGSPYFGRNVVQNGLSICGSGTTGCHGAFHGGDEEVARSMGEAILARPEKLAYVLATLGDERGRDFMRRIYKVEVL
jgi:hypothetical protein